MLRRRIPTLSLFVLAATALVLLAGPAAARTPRRARGYAQPMYNNYAPPMYYNGMYQPVSSYSGGAYQQFGPVYGPGYTTGFVPAGYLTGVPAQSTTMPLDSEGRQAFYNAPGQGFAQGSVRLNVHVPADADIWIDDFRTTQRGMDRLFVSPPLSPDREFHYEIMARWMEDGKPVTRTKTVAVRAGQLVHVDLLGSAAAEESSPARNRERETP